MDELNIELPYDTAISLLDIYTKELKADTGTDIFALVFIVILFTMV